MMMDNPSLEEIMTFSVFVFLFFLILWAYCSLIVRQCISAHYICMHGFWMNGNCLMNIAQNATLNNINNGAQHNANLRD